MRLNGTRSFSQHILGRYLKDGHYDLALEGFRTKDIETAFRAMHIFKGAASIHRLLKHISRPRTSRCSSKSLAPAGTGKSTGMRVEKTDLLTPGG